MTKETQTDAPVAEAAVGTDIAKVGSQVPATADSVALAELVAAAEAAPEKLGLGDVSVPYIYLLQPGSPQVAEGGEKQVKGARPSMFYNTATGELWDRENGFPFVPVAYEVVISEWLDREKGLKGWVADHDREYIKTANNGKIKLVIDEKKRTHDAATGNVLEETAFHYIIGMSKSGRPFEAIMPMKSTGLGGSRAINDFVKDWPIPGTNHILRYLYPMKATSFMETKNGNSWWKYRIAKLGPSSADPENKGLMTKDILINGEPEIWTMAKAFSEQFRKGLVRRAVLDDVDANAGASAPAGGNGGGNAGQEDLDDEIPF